MAFLKRHTFSGKEEYQLFRPISRDERRPKRAIKLYTVVKKITSSSFCFVFRKLKDHKRRVQRIHNFIVFQLEPEGQKTSALVHNRKKL